MIRRSHYTTCTMVSFLTAFMAPMPKLSSLLPASRRWRHGSTGPESDHLSGSLRHSTRGVTPPFRDGLAPGVAQSCVGAAHPHAEQRVSLNPRIVHVSFHFGSNAPAMLGTTFVQAWHRCGAAARALPRGGAGNVTPPSCSVCRPLEAVSVSARRNRPPWRLVARPRNARPTPRRCPALLP